MDATIVEVGLRHSRRRIPCFVRSRPDSAKLTSRQKRILLIVAAVNLVWAATIACSPLIAIPAWFLALVEVARMSSWLVFTIDLLGLLRQNATERQTFEISWRGVACGCSWLHFATTRTQDLRRH